jgi:diguanylate cyclase (GGDEF)-like protein
MEAFLDSFNSAHLVMNSKRDITFCNRHALDLLDWEREELYKMNLCDIFTKGSNIFIDSYIYPLLINEFSAQELQMTIITSKGEKVPVVANIRFEKENKTTYWSFFSCINRDKLYQELIQAKELLEKQGQELLKLATVDPLTGLLNRRELDNQVAKILSHAKRNKSSVALIVIDIDLFKNINDNYGHAFGDDVLKGLAKILYNKHREHDIVARFGGEEFIIVFPDVNKKNALKLAETIRLNIEKNKINGINITASIGVSTTSKNSYDFNNLFKEADSALYTAKKEGRNRTILY